MAQDIEAKVSFVSADFFSVLFPNNFLRNPLKFLAFLVVFFRSSAITSVGITSPPTTTQFDDDPFVLISNEPPPPPPDDDVFFSMNFLTMLVKLLLLAFVLQNRVEHRDGEKIARWKKILIFFFSIKGKLERREIPDLSPFENYFFLKIFF
ncbi:hypothetical protein ACOSP7_008166 [Xanthoceras sorbifolium]